MPPNAEMNLIKTFHKTDRKGILRKKYRTTRIEALGLQFIKIDFWTGCPEIKAVILAKFWNLLVVIVLS